MTFGIQISTSTLDFRFWPHNHSITSATTPISILNHARSLSRPWFKLFGSVFIHIAPCLLGAKSKLCTHPVKRLLMREELDLSGQLHKLRDRDRFTNSPQSEHSTAISGRVLARDGFTTMVYILLGLAALVQGALLIWTAFL